jgi:WXG100 family type VII secretion target
MSNVQEVADQMGVLAAYIQNLLADLEASSQASLAQWASNARDAYTPAKRRWDEAADKMAQQAQAAQNSLTSINNAYALAEYQGLGLWSN